MSATKIMPATPNQEKLLTADEFLEQYGDRPADLIRGHIVEQPMPGPRHGKICYRVAQKLSEYIEPRRLGHIFLNDTHFRTQRRPDSARGMDVCFISYGRLPDDQVTDGVLTVPPELVFEVLSPSNRDPEMEEKIEDYLVARVDAVAVLDPAEQTATLHRAGRPVEVFSATDAFVLPDILPGLSIPVRAFFE